MARLSNSLQCLSCLNSSFTKTHFHLLSPLIQFLTIVSEHYIKLPTEGIKHSHDGFSEHPFGKPVIQGHTSSPPPPHREFYGKTAEICLLQSDGCALTVTYMECTLLQTNTHKALPQSPNKRMIIQHILLF